MTFLPIVQRELSVAARRRSTYWMRMIMAIIAILVGGMMLLAGAIFPMRSNFGAQMFGTLTVMAFAFCALAGVFLTADCLSEEKREGTLGLLFLTDLKGYDVVLGKLMVNSLTAFYGFLATFPVLAITLCMGGVTVGEFWRVVLVFIVTLLFSLAIGIFISAVSRQDQKAMFGTFGLILLIAGGLPALERLLQFVRAPGSWNFSIASPAVAFSLAFDSHYLRMARDFWLSLLIILLLGWCFLILASITLPRFWQEGTSAVSTTKSSSVNERDRPARTTSRARLLDRNPVLWLASRNVRHALIPWVLCALVVVVILAMPIRVFRLPIGFMTHSFAGGLSFFVKIMVSFQASHFFAEARRTGALELLLMTPLTIKDILRGQWLALRRVLSWPVICVLVVPLLPALLYFGAPLIFRTPLPPNFQSRMFELFRVPFDTATFLADVFAVAWVGMWMGLSAKKPSRAPGLTLLYSFLLPAVLNMFFVPLLWWAAWSAVRPLSSIASNLLAFSATTIPGLIIDAYLIFRARSKLHMSLNLFGRQSLPNEVTNRPVLNAPPIITN